MDAQQATEFLNKLLKTNQRALSDLIFQRVSCHQDLAKLGKLVVKRERVEAYSMSLLGFLNSILTNCDENDKYVTAIITDDNELISRFEVYDESRFHGYDDSGPTE